jgi:integration host factor subunit beta
MPVSSSALPGSRPQPSWAGEESAEGYLASSGCRVQCTAANTEPALTRSDLIAELAISNPHLRAADAELIVTAIFDQISDALARGGRVELRGFGAFTVKRRNARIGRNPRTGEAVSVDEKAALFVKAGTKLRVRLNRDGMKPSRAATTAPVPADEV